MGYAPQLIFAVPQIASGATLSSSIFLGNKSYSQVSLVVPTMTSGTDVFVQGCDTETGTYRRIFGYTSTSTYAVLQIPSSVTNCVIPLPGYMPYIKVELGTAMTANAASFKLVCND